MEEIHLLHIYADRDKQTTLENIVSALPYMDTETQKLAQRTMKKVKVLTGDEFAQLAVGGADSPGPGCDF